MISSAIKSMLAKYGAKGAKATNSVKDHVSINATKQDILDARKLLNRGDGESTRAFMRRVRKKAKEVRKKKLIKSGLIGGAGKLAAIGSGAAYLSDDRSDSKES